MSTLARRDNSVQLQTGTALGVAASYKVNVLPVGAQVVSVASLTITVRAGHGFVAGDKWIANTTVSTFTAGATAAVASVTPTSLVMGAAWVDPGLVAGDILLNLGPDTSTTASAPAYDASPVKIYNDMAGATTAIANSEVTTGSDGQYGYWSRATGAWELFRTASGAPVDFLASSSLGSINPSDYGVTFDGTTDDTARIAAVLLQGVGRVIEFPEGTAVISPVGTNPKTCLTLTGGMKVAGQGIGKTILKVKDNAGSYATLLTCGSNDVTGLEICGITFDHNIVNNALPSGGTYSTANDSNVTVAVYAGTDINIHDLEIKNASSVNNIVVNGTTCSRIRISGIHGKALGDDPNDIAHDASIIYTHATEVDIESCHLVASASGDPGAITGIETHGSNTTVRGNTVKNFKIGANITGSFEFDTTNVVVSDNKISGALFGIALWSVTGTGHTSGYGLDGVSVHNNTIALLSNSTWGTGVAQGGVIIHAKAGGETEMDSRGLSITDNVIVHPLEGTAITNNNTSLAIGWYSADSKTIYHSLIARNIVIGFPMSGIRLSCGCQGVKVTDNVLVNCGSTQWAGVTESYRSPIFIGSPDVDGLFIERNSIIDTTATVAYLYAINCLNTSTVNMQVTDNTFQLAGSLAGGFLYYLPQNANSTFFLRGSAALFASYKTSGATQKYSLGSSMLDTSTGSRYWIGGDQYTWASGIPRNVGTWTINSVTDGTDTACTNGKAYVGSVFLPESASVTGIQYLVGSVGGTDKVIASLHAANGTLLANSNAAGTTVGTTAQLQQVAFTSAYTAPGPAWYFVALTFNGTTAKFRTVPAYCNAGTGVIGNEVTQTFGTPAAFTAPTTFTADKVPVASIY